MNSYQDKWTRWHDKPTDGVNYSSNNGWIYSAYAKYLAPDTTDRSKLVTVFTECVVDIKQLKINRSPDQVYPPLSKDEIIGLVSLGFINADDLSKVHWNYTNLPYYNKRPLNPLKFIKAVRALWSIRKEERQYVYKNSVKDAYPLAFRLTPNNQYYVKLMSGKIPSPLDIAHFWLGGLFAYFKGNKSSRMMLWLKMRDIHPGVAKLLPVKKWVKTYFGTEHTFYKNIKDS